MHDSDAVDRIEAVEEVKRKYECLCWRQRTESYQRTTQRFTAQEIHHDKRTTAWRYIKVVNQYDILVFESAERLGFDPHMVDCPPVGGDGRPQQLRRIGLAEPLVFDDEDLRRRAITQSRNSAILGSVEWIFSRSVTQGRCCSSRDHDSTTSEGDKNEV